MSLLYSLQHFTLVTLKVESLIYSSVSSLLQQNLELLPNIATFLPHSCPFSLSRVSDGRFLWCIQLYADLKYRRGGSIVFGKQTIYGDAAT